MNVVYGEKVVANLLHHTSPSSYKPRLLVEHLQRLNYRLRLHEPPALSREDLCRAHHPEYVEEILSCQEYNGFDNKDPDVAASLPYTSGSLYLAACLALEHKMAASFSSGFHHACYERAGGFCTFNGLVVTACKLHKEKRIRNLLILDLDYHYGDGTDDILRRQGIEFVRHETLGRHFRSGSEASAYLDRVEAIMNSLESQPVDLILFQAGADVHVKDPLGGLLTTEEMGRRDQLVFTGAHRLGVPLAWNLAGGYQRDENGSIDPVLRLHEQTYRLAQEIYGADG